MHRSFTSLPQGLYPPHANWNGMTRTNSFSGGGGGVHGSRYQMPPPLSPAERPHTPGSSRSLRLSFPIMQVIIVIIRIHHHIDCNRKVA